MKHLRFGKRIPAGFRAGSSVAAVIALDAETGAREARDDDFDPDQD